MIKRKMVMVVLVGISGINGVIHILRMIKSMKRPVESLMVLIILGLLIQTELVIDTTRSVGLLKLIPPVCMQTSRNRKQVANLLQLTRL